MGLMYPFPISEKESDFVIQDHQHQKVTIKSYGLPYIFWFYALAALTVYSFMMLGIWSTLMKLLMSDDQINQTLALCFLVFCGSLPLMLFGFFFYQKTVTSNHINKTISISHKIAGLTFRKKVMSFQEKINLKIDHFLDSPNMARLQGNEQMRGFKNKGYFLLEAISDDNKKRLLIDRSSSKADLMKVQKLLTN